MSPHFAFPFWFFGCGLIWAVFPISFTQNTLAHCPFSVVGVHQCKVHSYKKKSHQKWATWAKIESKQRKGDKKNKGRVTHIHRHTTQAPPDRWKPKYAEVCGNQRKNYLWGTWGPDLLQARSGRWDLHAWGRRWWWTSNFRVAELELHATFALTPGEAKGKWKENKRYLRDLPRGCSGACISNFVALSITSTDGGALKKLAIVHYYIESWAGTRANAKFSPAKFSRPFN